MFIDSTVALCLGNFMRQELKSALEQEQRVGGASDAAYSPLVSERCDVSTLELVVLHTMNLFCDPHTNAHAQRLVDLAEATGNYLQLVREEISLLRLSALLHDIGKVSVPGDILGKPGPLDADERALVRLHPEIGQQILLLAGGVFACLAPIVVAHHEAWDGSGYPAGLAGVEIPQLARILAVVDSYDAMTSYRTYGQPLSQREASRELERCAGSQYDPAVVRAFLRILNSCNTSGVDSLSTLTWLTTSACLTSAEHELPNASQM